MLDESESQSRLGRRAVAVGIGAMLMSGTELVGCATEPANNEKKQASDALPADLPYTKPAPFTGEEFWLSMLALLNESFTNVITQERVELALGRKFVRFSDETRSNAFLDMGKTWYFNVKYSTLHGILEVWGMDQGHGSFSNGPLLFTPLVGQSLERTGWLQYLRLYGSGLHAEYDPSMDVAYQRNGKAISFGLNDGKHVSHFAIALNHTNPDRK